MTGFLEITEMTVINTNEVYMFLQVCQACHMTHNTMPYHPINCMHARL